MMFFTVFTVLCLCSGSFAHPMWKRNFECPPPEEIHPCKCYTHPKRMVKCDEVKNLEIVHQALDYQFMEPLPELQLNNIHTFQLPDHAFNNISTKKLVVTHSNIRRIDDHAFDGQDSLLVLFLTDDRLTEFPTEALKRLPKLITLSLAGNFIMKLTKNSLTTFDELRYLILVDNRLSLIEENSFPSSLKVLSVGKNLLTTLNGTVKNLPSLEALVVNDNRLTSVDNEFEGLPQLTFISLSGNNIANIVGAFDEVPSLTDLNLSYNKLDDIEDGLLPLKKLRSLNVSYNNLGFISENLFKNLNKIEVLDLSGNYIKNVCPLLKPLKRMTNLRLSNLNLKTLDYDCLKHMKKLLSIDLSNNELSSVDAVIAHPFPVLWALNIHNNQLQSLRHGLKNLRRLIELDIRNNELNTIKDHHLIHNTELRALRIGGNPLICTDRLIFVLRDLATRMVSIDGPPDCYLEENIV